MIYKLFESIDYPA